MKKLFLTSFLTVTSLSISTYAQSKVSTQQTGYISKLSCGTSQSDVLVDSVANVIGKVGQTVSIDKLKALIQDEYGNLFSGTGIIENSRKVAIMMPATGFCKNTDAKVFTVTVVK